MIARGSTTTSTISAVRAKNASARAASAARRSCRTSRGLALRALRAARRAPPTARAPAELGVRRPWAAPRGPASIGGADAGPADPTTSIALVLARWRTYVAALLGYAAVSCLLFGWRLLPHPGQKLIGFGAEGKQRDPEIFVWSFAWWPHAIAHWTNPFFTHEIFAPTRINLTWTTSVPGLALAFSPLTWLLGPDGSSTRPFRSPPGTSWPALWRRRSSSTSSRASSTRASPTRRSSTATS